MENKRQLIDVNKVINAMQKCLDEEPDKKDSVAYFAFESIIECLKQEPTVDAVEVVRCKDCKHKGWIQEPCHGKSVDYCHIWDSCINDSEKDFCSYGERKDIDWQ